MEDFDFVVIGGGSGGVRAARIAASFGAKVALVESGRLGGTCVNVGCVPKKLMVYGASFAERFHEARGFGWTFDSAPRFDWATLVDAREKDIRRLNGIYEKLLLDAGVTIVDGFGVFEEPRVVRVGERRLRGEHVLIATGGRSRIPPIPGAELGGSSDEFFALRELPKRVVVAGGGYIGVELASVFRALGSEVHVVHRNPELLNAFDHDVRRFFAEQLELHGITLHLGHTIERLDRDGASVVATLDDGTKLAADLQLAAVGRVPNTAKLGLEEVGVKTGRDGAVLVDDTFATSQQNVWALGDCIGRVQLTPVALAEGMALARRLFGGQPDASVDYDLVPTAVFATPEVATVGLTEEAAWHRGERPKIFRSTFRPMKHTLSGLPYRMMMKLVVCEVTDRVLGVHVVGPDAGEIVQGFAVALRAGATKAQLDATIGIHPTAAEELVTMRTPVPSMHV
ncbi:MAG: glutathione-disulfide reductase [Sandaracinus sp.]|nr:glutathione-disulfide reductase [Myxococcales bacterium]MCB9611450.1 glutathione-disulfide reductase [Sandaracinus sp.]MCB9620589.1 glutathione-disulfide reductase [Sandaracinus sp.]MCB9621711.1 glutathione-disulfide reductase [Sandaracinus sp.]MCB9633910.1 glutathione-disulfide reductase [Sandaracinus sp.]